MAANNASRTYGATNPVFSGTITGIQNGDNITATYATTATATSPVGTYPITPTLVDPSGKLQQLHRQQHQRHAERDGGGSDGGGQQRLADLRRDQPGVQRHHYRHPERRQHHRHLRHHRHGDQPGGLVSDHADPGGSERQADQLHRQQHQRHVERDGGRPDGRSQ